MKPILLAHRLSSTLPTQPTHINVLMAHTPGQITLARVIYENEGTRNWLLLYFHDKCDSLFWFQFHLVCMVKILGLLNTPDTTNTVQDEFLLILETNLKYSCIHVQIRFVPLTFISVYENHMHFTSLYFCCVWWIYIYIIYVCVCVLRSWFGYSRVCCLFYSQIIVSNANCATILIKIFYPIDLILVFFDASHWLTHLPLDKMAAIFADDIFKCISMHETFCISIQISSLFLRARLTISEHWFG